MDKQKLVVVLLVVAIVLSVMNLFVTMGLDDLVGDTSDVNYVPVVTGDLADTGNANVQLEILSGGSG